MSTPTAVARAELAKVLRDHEDYLLSVTKSKAVDLSEKMFQSFLISDSMMDQFSSLDHNRVEPQLQLRYLLRLVTQRIQQDESVGDKLLSLLESCGEHFFCEFVRRSRSGDTQPGVTRECSDDSLGPEDMLSILEVLSEASYKWENIAIALGLRTCQRKNIKGEDNIINLSNVLEVWLSGGSTKPPTINTLTQALNSQLVGQGRLAMELQKQFKVAKSPVEVSYNTVTDTSSLPFTIIRQSPRKVEVEDGKSTLLLVQVSHRENVSYQWNKNNQPLADNHTCTGIHDNILLINHAHQGTGGEYTCCVSSEEREVVSNKVTLTVLYPDEKKALLDLYSVNTQVSLEETWPPVGADMFINLVLVKRSQQSEDSFCSTRHTDKLPDKTEKVEYEEFRAYRSGSLVLVEGRPGSGKTTLVHKHIKDWADGTALVHAKLVFLVSLRSLCSDQGDTLFSLLQPLYSNSGASLENVVSAIEKKNGQGVCFVFDGLDEYHPQVKDKTVVFRLLHKSYLPLAMVIVSSRPGALARLRQEVVTQHIEVFGFTEEQIYEYIDKFPFGTCSDSSFGPAKLKEYLKSHPNVLDMCYLPIHAAIICFVYQTKRGHLPHTQTQIYTEFARSMILRHLKRKDTEVQLYSLKELPDSVCDSFSKLCLLAFNMTLEGKQVMNAREVSICEDTSPHGDWSLGLVTCNRTAQLYGISTSYMFLHLTLQEFLAAYHVVNTEGEEKREIMKSHFALHSMWTFYFGLEIFESEKELEMYRNVLSSRETSTIYAFESQQKVVCDEVVRLHPDMGYSSNDVPSNIQALQFVISNSSHLISDITLDYFTLKQIQHLKFPELKRLVVIPVSRSVYTAVSNDVDSTTVQYLSRILTSCTQLEYACLYFDDLQTEGGGYLADSLRYLVNLEDLTLRLFRINSDVSERTCPGLVLVLNQIHCLSRIKKLNISDWRMDLNCCKALASNVCQLTNIEDLIVCNNGIESDGAVCLASTFHHLTKLESLDLSRFGSDCAARLVSSLHHFTTLKMLDLSNNNIGLDGATRLASQLHHLTELGNLNLAENSIGVEGAIQVITGLKDCQKLTCVYLNVGLRISNLSFSNNFYLEGLVSSDDSDIIGRIIAATKLHKRTIKLHLGFRTIIVLPLKNSLLITCN